MLLFILCNYLSLIRLILYSYFTRNVTFLRERKVKCRGKYEAPRKVTYHVNLDNRQSLYSYTSTQNAGSWNSQ